MIREGSREDSASMTSISPRWEEAETLKEHYGALKILDEPQSITWDYDEEADVLYLSVGEPQMAVGVDIGEGVVVRYDESSREVAGLTVVGLRERLLAGLAGIDQTDGSPSPYGPARPPGPGPATR